MDAGAEPTSGQDRPATERPAGGSDDHTGLCIVRVVPGRRRFHAPECPLLADKDVEEITLDDARDEGFTACTTCAPNREPSGL